MNLGACVRLGVGKRCILCKLRAAFFQNLLCIKSASRFVDGKLRDKDYLTNTYLQNFMTPQKKMVHGLCLLEICICGGLVLLLISSYVPGNVTNYDQRYNRSEEDEEEDEAEGEVIYDHEQEGKHDDEDEDDDDLMTLIKKENMMMMMVVMMIMITRMMMMMMMIRKRMMVWWLCCL